MTKYRRDFRKIAEKLTLSDLQSGLGEEEITLDSLIEGGRIKQGSELFLDLFSSRGIDNVLEVFGIKDALSARGLKNISIRIDTSDPYLHKLFIYFDNKTDCNHCICELVMKKSFFRVKQKLPGNFPSRPLNFLHIEWLLLQNPTRSFTDDKPPLPGQNYPGLGLGDMLVELLILLGRRLRFEGISNKPAYFHTAFMFTRDCSFLNPEYQGLIVSARKKLLRNYSFYTVAWASYLECIYFKDTGEKFVWQPDWIILPLSKELIKYFRSWEYRFAVKRAERKFDFEIDKDKLKELMRKKGLPIKEDLTVE